MNDYFYGYNSYDEMIADIEKNVSDGYINHQDMGNLRLYNYNQNTQIEKRWNKATFNCRGLIVDTVKKCIVARCLSKFFNFEETDRIIPKCDFIASEKMDGSCGIIYFYNDKWNVATRGSFSSDQAIKAEQMLYTHYDVCEMNKDYTYICEIIYPDNKIVVDYGSREDLVLLTIFDVKTGEEFTHDNVEKINNGMFTRPKVFSGSSFFDLMNMVKKWDKNNEGIVVRFDNGYRVKVKSEEYIRYHKILSDFSPLAIWENMLNGKTFEDMKLELPEEMWNDLEMYCNNFENNYNYYINLINHTYWATNDMTDKKLGLLKEKSKGEENFIYSMVFLVRNNKFQPDLIGDRSREAIFKKFRPTANVLKGY